MRTSEQTNELFAAIAKAQGEMKSALKTAINSAFARGGQGGSKYATLADCADAAHPTLSKHGLCLIQCFDGGDFVARVGHSSGQWVEGRWPVPGDLSKMTIQNLIACQTYLRRASYSLVGLVSDEDDDGNEAAKVGTINPAKDTKLVNKWAKALIDAQDDQGKLYGIWCEIKEDHDFAGAVWATMPRAMKDRINDAVNANKPKEAA